MHPHRRFGEPRLAALEPAQDLAVAEQRLRGLESGQPRLAEAAMRMHIIGAAEFLTEVIDDDE